MAVCLYVFDKSFNLLGTVDVYDSLTWTRNYYVAGTFSLELKLPRCNKYATEIISLLKRGNLLVKENDLTEAAYIETIKLNDEASDALTVQGLFIDAFIGERVIWGTQTASGTAGSAMAYFVQQNCVTPTDSKRVIPNLLVSQNTDVGSQIEETYTYSNLRETIEELAVKHDVGWRVAFDLTNKRYIFEPYQGRDLTIDQDVNPRAIFSTEYENVESQEYTESDSGYKNMAIIGGKERDDTPRIYVTVNDDLSGFDRRELFVDASSVSLKDENDNELTDSEYRQLLIEQGKTELAERQQIRTFDSSIITVSNLIYRKDYDLGDKVTVFNRRWGIVLNTRVVSVEEIYEGNRVNVRVEFGGNVPNPFERLLRRVNR